jgi:hypothetical protein
MIESTKYRHANGGFAVSWDRENMLLYARGRMRSYASFQRDAATGAVKLPWVEGHQAQEAREMYKGRHHDWTWVCGNSSSYKACDMGTIEATVRNGWSDGVAKVQQCAQKIRNAIPQAEDITPRFVWGAEGDELDMHRVWDGELERAWYGRDKGIGPAPRVVRLLTPMGGSAGMSQEKMFWVGAGALVLTDALERAGYRCELKSYNSSYHPGGDGHYSIAEVTLKRSSDYVANATLAAGLCLAAWFRAIGFRWEAFGPVETGVSFGRVTRIDKCATTRKHAERIGLLDNNTVLMGTVGNESECVAEIKRCITLIQNMRQ